MCELCDKSQLFNVCAYGMSFGKTIEAAVWAPSPQFTHCGWMRKADLPRVQGASQGRPGPSYFGREGVDFRAKDRAKLTGVGRRCERRIDWQSARLGNHKTVAEVLDAWKKKMAAFHPDRIQGKNLAPEWLELANQKSAKINAAYETIKASRR